jgi:hypothetical protein
MHARDRLSQRNKQTAATIRLLHVEFTQYCRRCFLDEPVLSRFSKFSRFCAILSSLNYGARIYTQRRVQQYAQQRSRAKISRIITMFQLENFDRVS